jgi:hypothetical protein
MLQLTGVGGDEQALQATGTDSVCAGLRPVCALPDLRSDQRDPAETEAHGKVNKEAERNQLILQAVEADQGQSIPVETNTPDRTRTCDRRFRKPMLYPAELRGHSFQRLSLSRLVLLNSSSPPHLRMITLLTPLRVAWFATKGEAAARATQGSACAFKERPPRAILSAVAVRAITKPHRHVIEFPQAKAQLPWTFLNSYATVCLRSDTR